MLKHVLQHRQRDRYYQSSYNKAPPHDYPNREMKWREGEEEGEGAASGVGEAKAQDWNY